MLKFLYNHIRIISFINSVFNRETFYHTDNRNNNPWSIFFKYIQSVNREIPSPLCTYPHTYYWLYNFLIVKQRMGRKMLMINWAFLYMVADVIYFNFCSQINHRRQGRKFLHPYISVDKRQMYLVNFLSLGFSFW